MFKINIVTYVGVDIGVREVDTTKEYTVYKIRTVVKERMTYNRDTREMEPTDIEHTEFLLYANDKWMWRNCLMCVPVSEVR